MDIKNFTILLTLMLSFRSFAFCKINRYGHSICGGEKALLASHTISSIDDLEPKDLRHSYRVVTIRRVHTHEPIAIISSINSLIQRKVHIDKLMGQKICEHENGCFTKKIRIKAECQKENSVKLFYIQRAYEDETLKNDYYQIKMPLGIDKFRTPSIFHESCIDFQFEEVSIDEEVNLEN